MKSGENNTNSVLDGGNVVERDLSFLDSLRGSPVPGTPGDGAYESVESLSGAIEAWEQTKRSLGGTEVKGKDRPVWLRVWDLELRPMSRKIIGAKIRKLEKKKKMHYKTRLKRRREKYYRCQREGKLRRDKLLTTYPEGLYKYYKSIAKRKKIAWRISEEEFCNILYSEYLGTPIYKYIFNIVRIDKDKSIGYSTSNITIVDRYNSTIYYSPKE